MRNPVSFDKTDYKTGSQPAISIFKLRLSSVMAFIMSRHFLFCISAVVLIALAACGKSEDENAAVPADNGAAVSDAAQPADATPQKKGPDLVKALRDNSGVVTPEEKAAVINRVRENAQAAARSVGQSDEQAQAAGEVAVQAAQRSFESRQP